MSAYKISISSLAVVSFLLASCSKQAPPAKEIIRPVKAIQVGNSSSMLQTILSGKAKATQEINVAFEVSGRIVRMGEDPNRPLDVGETVKKGQQLAALDPRNFQNMMVAAEAESERASTQRDRIKKAFDSNAVSEQDLTNAEAQAKAADAALKIAQKQLEDTVIYAPFDGTIAAKYVENYQNIIQKQKIMRILDISKIEMVVDVPESLIPNVPYVEKITVTFAAFPSTEITAEIKEVGTEASQTTRTYPVTLLMDQPEDPNVTILPGMAGEAKSMGNLPPERLTGGIPVPPSAIFGEGEGEASFVWKINEGSGIANKSLVKVDRFTTYGAVVTEGINPGDWVVTAGVHSLKEGQKVTILNNK